MENSINNNNCNRDNNNININNENVNNNENDNPNNNINNNYIDNRQIMEIQTTLPWNKLWNLKIPPKIKNFSWRACNETIPMKVNLNKRKINIQIAFLLCKDEDETIVHGLVANSYKKSGMLLSYQ